MEVALRDIMGLDNETISAIHDMFELMDDSPDKQPHHQPSRAFLRDTKAMKATAADVVELPNSYHFVVDTPGLKRDEIKVHIEDDGVLVVSGDRKRKDQKQEGVKYLKMERRVGKLLKKFVLPENADKEKVTAVCEDGVLTVAVEKRAPVPEKKKTRVIEVKSSGGGATDEKSSGAGGGGVSEKVDGGGGGVGSEKVDGGGSWHESGGSQGDEAK